MLTLSRSAVAVLASALVGVCALVSLPGPFDSARERAFDLLLSITRRTPSATAPIVVDIDRASLAELGPWPWGRERLAELVGAITAAHPRVLAVDILLDEPDARSPAAIARRLAGLTGDKQLELHAGALPDGDAQLATALGAAPTVLAVALDPEHAGNGPSAPPFLVRGEPDVTAFWHASGAIGPTARLADAAAGLGVAALPGDSDAAVRRVPLLAVTGTVLRAGLALEAIRVARSASAYLLIGDPLSLGVGADELRLQEDAALRLRPVPEAVHAGRSIGALALLHDSSARAGLRDGIVLLGSSAPEVGGLRPSLAGDLVPTVHIQADAVAQILAGDFPARPGYLALVELACALGFGWLAGHLAARNAPAIAALATLAIATGWVLIAVGTVGAGVLLNPLPVPLVATASFATVALVTASQVRRREAAIRRRFEQYVPAAVVRSIVAQPGLLKLEGELREVSVLCADVEGFTAMTARAEPRRLLRLLDLYFDGVTQIVIDHGGMVDKIVGDGLIALFNVPLDLPDHAARALECALGIGNFSRRLRTTPEAASLGLGRTRIGMECGKLVVGDVGGGRRLDYTAYGEAMNLAAQLEAANKELGSAICVGPNMAACLPPQSLRALGSITIRGVSQPIAVFEPWPDALGPADRAEFLAAAGALANDPAAAVRRLRTLSDQHPDDTALRRYADRVAAGLPGG